MRFSRAFIPTRKDDPADAEMPSHKLLVRAGYIEQVSAGIYNLLPMGWRAVHKIENIVREELDRAGAQELLMPMVQPAELWQKSGRWEVYGSELLRFKDRKNQDYCLGPTHEEIITDLVRKHVRSYRDLPLNLYQIQGKFRDEPRPRAGLLRGREFIMKDAYSFDVDLDAAKVTYEAMHTAYTAAFSRCGLEFRPVEADSGNIGGSESHEFQVLAQTGEDRIVSCANCGYTANEELAAISRSEAESDIAARGAEAVTADAATPALEQVETPNKKTIEEVTGFLGVSPKKLIKTLLYTADDKVVAVLIPGDRDVNEVKLKNFLGATQLFMAQESAVVEATGAPVGFAGPVGLDIDVYADLAVGCMHDAVTGANIADMHNLHVEPARDFSVKAYADLTMAAAGDACPRCSTAMDDFRGIEVGHIFVLGTKYSEPLGANYLDADGETHPIVMGCYGIGITRVLAAAIEQNHDEHGMILPMAIAPYHVMVLPLQMQKPDVVAAGDKVYDALREAGIEVLLDDRDLRAGGKFKDADLVGIPLRITLGSRGLAEGNVELKHRAGKDSEMVPIDDIVDVVKARIAAELSAS